MLLLEIVLGFAIGLSLGLLGGGGSILTVPALVYLIGQTPQAAVTTSLAIVGANSLLGANFHRTQGTLDWQVAVLFGSVGMLGAYLTSGISELLSPAMLMAIFSVLMLVIGLFMLTRKSQTKVSEKGQSLWVVIVSGILVGVLTGVLGVGGGFLIVPALVMLVGLPIQLAVGTSLVVIAMNSFAGLAGRIGYESVNVSLIMVFGLAGLAGTFTGSRLAKLLPAQKMQNIFAWFVIALAVFLLVDNVQKIIIGM
jgi:uncharacterized protein